jgi:hypothetical protein
MPIIDTLNLDAMHADELMTFWSKYSRATKANRVELFGRTGEGTVTAARALANYASNKATAMQCRARGDLHAALLYEGICDNIFESLPDYARW